MNTITPIRKLEAGVRLRAMRELTGLTQEEFGEVVGLSLNRIKNIETLRVKLNADDIVAVCTVFPELLEWLALEGDITLLGLKESTSKLCRMIAAKLEAGLIPEGYFLNEKIK